MVALFLSLYVRASDTFENRVANRQRGQGTLEYVGMIAVAALLIVAVVGAFKTANLGAKVTTILNSVTSII